MTLDPVPDALELASNETVLHTRLSIYIREYSAFVTETYQPEEDRWTLVARHDASSTFVIEGIPSTPEPDFPARGWNWRHEHSIPRSDGTIITLATSGETPSKDVEDLADRVKTWAQIASTLGIRAEYVAIDPLELVCDGRPRSTSRSFPQP